MAHQPIKIPFALKLLIVFVIVGVLVYVSKPFFIITEGEMAVVTRFGQITRTEETAGLKFKAPFIDSVTRYSKKILPWDGEPRRVPTYEKQFIWVDTTARWRIVDPRTFYKSVNTMNQAFSRLDDVIESAVRTIIAGNKLVEAVRNTNDIMEVRDTSINDLLPSSDVDDSGIENLSELVTQLEKQPKINKGRRSLSEEMLVSVKKLVPEFGIEVIDIVIRQIRYADDLTESVYSRMISERKRIAQVYRSQGEGRKQELLGQLENEKRSILSGAYSQAEAIRGTADAEAASIYANAYGQNQSFFQFWRAMESYKKTAPSLDKVLSTEGDYFRYFYRSSGR